MSAHDIDPGVRAAIADFRLPERLGFGDINAPVMFQADWRRAPDPFGWTQDLAAD
jgi:hypothetical protein